MHRLLPLVFIVLSFVSSARASIVTTPEAQVTAPIIDVAAFDQANARIATGSNSSFAVWADRDRNGAGDILGAYVTPAGERIGEVIRIATTEADENHPAVVWGGGRVLVVWTTETAVLARFIGEGDAFLIGSLADFRAVRPQVAYNGSVFLAVWATGNRFAGAIVGGPGGGVFDAGSAERAWPEIGLVSVAGGFQLVSAIGDFSGNPGPNGFPSDVGVTPIAENGLAGTRVVLAAATTPVFDLVAVSRGDDYFVAWSTARGVAGGAIRSVRVTPSGADPIETFAAEGMFVHDAGADAGGFFIVYGNDSQQYLRRHGSAIATELPKPSGTAAVLDVAGNLAIVRGLATIGYEFGPAGGDLYVLRLDTGTFDPLVVAPRHQESPDLDGNLAAWCEYVGSDRRLTVMASRLGVDSTAIDLQANVYHPVIPRVAASGNGWLVVWLDFTTIYASRVAADGTRLDATPFVVATDVYASEVDVAWDGSTYVVVFMRGVNLRGVRTAVQALRVTAQGVANGPEIQLSPDISANEHVSIVAGGEGTFAVWRHNLTLEGALLSRGGTVTPVAFPVAEAGFRTSVAWNGETFLAASRPVFLISPAGVLRPTSLRADEVSGGGGRFLLLNGPYASLVDSNGQLLGGPLHLGVEGARASWTTIIYARTIGHSTRELQRVFVREVQSVPGKPRRRAVRH